MSWTPENIHKEAQKYLVQNHSKECPLSCSRQCQCTHIFTNIQHWLTDSWIRRNTNVCVSDVFGSIFTLKLKYEKLEKERERESGWWAAPAPWNNQKTLTGAGAGAGPGRGPVTGQRVTLLHSTLHTRARPLAMSGPGPPQISQLIESVTGTPRGSKKWHCGDKNELYWWIRRKNNETETKTMWKSHYLRSYNTQLFHFLLL